MDKTTVFMGQPSQLIIDQRGTTNYIPSIGYESARVTCLFAIHMDGKKASSNHHEGQGKKLNVFQAYTFLKPEKPVATGSFKEVGRFNLAACFAW